MNVEPHKTALMSYLKSLNEVYFGKVLELREAVTGWLAYIPETFPHYTRHTVQHSDEIVRQVSKLLFKNDDPAQPAIRLSAAEAYVLIAAAYLHDSGMVSPDKEKLEIITSNQEWKNWTTGEGGGAKRWREIEKLRQGPVPADETTRHFIADLQTRFLIAEFIRRSHHLRAADVIRQHQSPLGRFAFDDPIMQRTIADVCVAHGLRTHELEDREKYPDRRDIQGYAVNVRLLAILLRLGDLLDMSYDRACPLLLNAANPLPADSYAHWTQYQRLTHRATSPDKIEITAECETQEEHRVLQDWCQWIVEEVSQAEILMSRVELHHAWQPPVATMDKPEASIKIRPAAGANYVPSKWTFELDHEAVLNLLIRDIYEDPLTFIRELIQNALDANRSQMYLDLVKDGIPPPEYPTQVDEERRQRYPVRVSLETRQVPNELSGEVEERQAVIVDDSGIGMDEEIIKRYFLQVGRSYYTTEEFRRNFGFIPTSRFGIGFLSVFAASDRIVVQTYKPSSPKHDEPLRLTLTGTRNYLLTEKGNRRASGTRIEVLLSDPIPQEKLTELVTGWCRRVEFPIFLDDLGLQQTVVAERPEQFTAEVPDVTEEGAKFVVRAFPVNRPGIEGEFYVFARVSEDGEFWFRYSYEREEYLRNHPQASLPILPFDLICLHGIKLDPLDRWPYADMRRERLDYRGNKFNLTLSRQSRRSRYREPDPEIESRWEEILREHLSESRYATSADSWKYKQSLVDSYPLDSLWDSLPGMIPVHVNGEVKFLSLKEVQAMPVISIAISPEPLEVRSDDGERDSIDITGESTLIIKDDFKLLSNSHNYSLIGNRPLTNARWLSRNILVLDWTLPSEKIKPLYSGVRFVKLPCPTIIGLPPRLFGSHLIYLINDDHAFAQWLKNVKVACNQQQGSLRSEQFDRLMRVTCLTCENPYQNMEKLNKHLAGWLEIPDLSPELYPPLTEVTPEMFQLKYPDDTSE